MRNRPAVLLALALGLLAALLTYVYLDQRERDLLHHAEMKVTLVATDTIEAGTLINENMVRRIQVPAVYLQPYALSDLRLVIGRVAAVPVPRDAQLMSTYLQDVRQTALAYEVPRGKRALTIAVSDVTGVGGLLRPGDFCDILGTFQFGHASSGANGALTYSDEKTATSTMMQNVPVAAVGRNYQGDRAIPSPSGRIRSQSDQSRAEAEAAADVANRNRPLQNVTVLVSPDEVQALVLAQKIGSLTLSLRSRLDSGQVGLTTLDPHRLLKASVPVKPRSAPRWEEIRGTSTKH
jgi:pilus assembly protein CpaB